MDHNALFPTLNPSLGVLTDLTNTLQTAVIAKSDADQAAKLAKVAQHTAE